MRTAAKVKEAVLSVSRNCFAFRKVVYEFNLVRLICKKFKGFFLRYFFAYKLMVSCKNAAHFFFYFRKINFAWFCAGGAAFVQKKGSGPVPGEGSRS